jgi:hypothetical protein
LHSAPPHSSRSPPVPGLLVSCVPVSCGPDAAGPVVLIIQQSENVTHAVAQAAPSLLTKRLMCWHLKARAPPPPLRCTLALTQSPFSCSQRLFRFNILPVSPFPSPLSHSLCLPPPTSPPSPSPLFCHRLEPPPPPSLPQDANQQCSAAAPVSSPETRRQQHQRDSNSGNSFLCQIPPSFPACFTLQLSPTVVTHCSHTPTCARC